MPRRRTLIPLFFIVLTDFLGMMLIVPLLPFYAQILKATPIQIGLLGSTFALCQLVGGPVLGRLSDRYGRKPILVVSQVGTLIGFIVMAWSQTLWLLFLSRAIDGITAGNVSVAQAYLADSTEPSERARAFGMMGAAFGISMLFGSAGSGFLAQYHILYPIYLAIGFSAVSIVLTVLWLHEARPTQPSSKAKSFSKSGIFRKKSFRPLFLLFFAFVFAFAFFSQGIGIFSQATFTIGNGSPYGPREIGYLFAYCGVIGIIIQGVLIQPLVKRFGEKRLIRFGFLFDVIGYSVLGASRSFGALIIGSSLFSLGNSVLRPALTSLISRRADASEQGEILGFTSSLQSLAFVVAPPIGGYLLEHFAAPLWAYALAALAAIAFVFTVAGSKVSRVKLLDTQTSAR